MALPDGPGCSINRTACSINRTACSINRTPSSINRTACSINRPSTAFFFGVPAGFVRFLHRFLRFDDPGRPRPCIWAYNDRKKIRFIGEPAHVSKCGPHVTFCEINELVLQKGDFRMFDRCTARTKNMWGSGRVPKCPNGT